MTPRWTTLTLGAALAVIVCVAGWAVAMGVRS